MKSQTNYTEVDVTLDNVIRLYRPETYLHTDKDNWRRYQTSSSCQTKIRKEGIPFFSILSINEILSVFMLPISLK